ncbi:MAG: nucleoside triphosphate pyrophosphohydrolase [Rhodobacteraceae bacterium]|nr:nucleoside triphosphate pyrophosphohydrolase [Paracoccaceae bacterium]
MTGTGGIDSLLMIIRRLRDPEQGCPWDVEQDYHSIAPHTLEEAYEVVDAIETGDMEGLEGELGDLLLQVVFLAQLGAEAGVFDFESVVNRLSSKLIDRHPHVFGHGKTIRTAAEQKEFWDASKQRERNTRSLKDILDSTARGLPAMQRALKLQEAVARKGFEFPSVSRVTEKMEEELVETKEAIASGDATAMQKEIGDLLFTSINLARICGVDPDQALRGVNRTFAERVVRVQSLVEAAGKNYESLSNCEQDRMWEAAKSDLNGRE